MVSSTTPPVLSEYSTGQSYTATLGFRAYLDHRGMVMCHTPVVNWQGVSETGLINSSSKQTNNCYMSLMGVYVNIQWAYMPVTDQNR